MLYKFYEGICRSFRLTLYKRQKIVRIEGSVHSVHSSTLQDSRIPFHNSPTHPLSLDFHTVALARPSPISRRSSTRRIRIRSSPIRKNPVLASLLSAASFYGACSESAKEGSKTVNLKGLLFTSFWRPDMLFSISLTLCD